MCVCVCVRVRASLLALSPFRYVRKGRDQINILTQASRGIPLSPSLTSSQLSHFVTASHVWLTDNVPSV